MRSKWIVALSVLMLAFGCKGKPSLTPDDVRYIRATIALIRLRSTIAPAIAPATDSTELNRRLDSVYRAFSTSKDSLLAETKSLGDDPARAGAIYAAIKDSLGIK